MNSEEPTLLIVDDEEPIHRALQRTLRREPYRLVHAYDAAEAWAMLRQHPEIRGIVCDHYMPGTRGLELLREVRERFPKVVTILLTAQADLQLVIDAINDGHVHQFITKPWSAEDLRGRLARLLAEPQGAKAPTPRVSEIEAQLEDDLLPARDEVTGAFIIEEPTGP